MDLIGATPDRIKYATFNGKASKVGHDFVQNQDDVHRYSGVKVSALPN
jgi:hypothetical protein